MQPELCQKLIDGNQKSSVKVQPAKGHLTKYRCVCVCVFTFDPVWIREYRE